ncbi:DUF4340 domain-containing protein [Clostridium sp. AF19-22AC]|jgi:hypothetical protein|uniref:DUF4340 domain-containing protein n=1 Tax=Clostridia TaxID=186801 RepID=UPI000E4D64ED|nr:MULTISPECIES: DUF4340 domain-containing protein [Clostridia]RHR29873.1 DUF4340 domain-containing protein [Clostridium sp. AF19-22AC]
MGQKKKKSMILLFAVLVVLVAAYFILQSWNKSQDKKEQAKEEAENIYITDIDTITDIKYNIGSGDMEFTKEDGTWYVTADKDFPLAQSYPEQMADTFKKLKAERELKDGDSLEDYGLTEPVYTVSLTDGEGGETTLYYGNAAGDDYYVTVGDEGKVYTVSSTTISDLQYSLEDMAQMDTYPNIGSGNLKKEVITQGGQTTTYDSENDDDAQNIAAVAGGLGAVTLSKAADYSVEDKDLAGFGLDEGSRTTVEAVYTSDDKEKTLTLYIGGTDGSGNRYVMMNDSRIVYLISEEICKNILNEE